MEQLHDYAVSGLFSETEKLVLAYADAMTRTPTEVPEEIVFALRAKFGEPELVELTATIAWENYRARFNHAFGLEAEGFSDGAFCAMPVSQKHLPRMARGGTEGSSAILLL